MLHDILKKKLFAKIVIACLMCNLNNNMEEEINSVFRNKVSDILV